MTGVTLFLIALVLCVIVALALLAKGLEALFEPDPYWTEIDEGDEYDNVETRR